MQEMMWVGHQGKSAVIFAPFVNMNYFEDLLYPKQERGNHFWYRMKVFRPSLFNSLIIHKIVSGKTGKEKS